MTLSIVYETHSLTEDNEAGIATGWLPGKLSAEGRRLAAELGERRRKDKIAAVFVSDLARAVETAGIAFEASDMPVFKDWRLRECDYGELNGVPARRLAELRQKHTSVPFPGGQSYEQVIGLTRDFLESVRGPWDGRRICLISHSANKWALDVIVHGKHLEELVDAPFDWREGWEYEIP
jgi:alpha-ribazole phosphatase/probable phosphoglycerate mutase